MNAPPHIADEDASSALVPVRSLERRRLRAYLLLVGTDVAVIFVAFLLAGFIYLQRFPDPQALNQAYLLLPIYLTIALYQGTYSIRTLMDFRFAANRAASALVIAAALLAFVAFYLKASASFSRVTLTLGLLLSAILIAATRRIAIGLIKRRWQGFVRNRLLILDGGDDLPIPANRRLDAQALGIRPDVDDPHALDLVGRMLVNQDEVIVSCPIERRAAWAFVLKASGVHGEILSPIAHELGALNVKRYEEADAATLVVSAGPLGLRARALKRVFDLLAASLSLALLAPFLGLVALAIWLEDGGSVLFVQQRTGRGNRFFSMYKFRTMRPADCDKKGHQSTERDDQRVTRVGRFLRTHSLDELPQLFNVLLGEMSIVGPRPHAPGSRAGERKFWQIDSRYWHRHALKPGLTGLAQVRGLRGSTAQERDLTDRLQADLEYLAQWSLLRDLAIVFQTIFVLRHRNAF